MFRLCTYFHYKIYVIPNLKSIFTNITDVLSMLNITTKEIDNCNTDKILKEMIKNLNNKIEIMNDTNTKSLYTISNNINTEDRVIFRKKFIKRSTLI